MEFVAPRPVLAPENSAARTLPRHFCRMLGILLTKWTIRLALLCYVGFLAGRLSGGGSRWPRALRWLWTIGCGLFLAHVACSFHFYHDWSHAAAWETTARETEALLGVRFGAGIYFSYLFLITWVLDVVCLWIGGSERGKARPLMQGGVYSMLVHAYLLFIAVNGAIVFEAGPTRWGGVLACILLASLWAWAACRGRVSTNEPSLHERLREHG